MFMFNYKFLISCLFVFVNSLKPIVPLTKSEIRRVGDNIGLVYHFSKRHQYGNYDEDLIQEGIIGLTRAAQKYDETRNTKFSTYASYWIRAHMSQYTRKNKLIYYPERGSKKYEKPDIVFTDANNGILFELIPDNTITIEDESILNTVIEWDGFAEEEKKMLKYRFCDNLSYSAIGKKYNRSKTHMTNTYNKIYQKIRDNWTKIIE